MHASPESQGATLLVVPHLPVFGSHLSSVHLLPSSHTLPLPTFATQLASKHTLPLVQASPSSHATWALLATGVVTHLPVLLSQASIVQGSASSHFTAVPFLQVAPKQVELVVHGLPSSQGPLVMTNVQSPFDAQPSTVQGLPSSHLFVADTHLPAVHVSSLVHVLPSSHFAVFAAWTQPVLASQLSSVQTLPSLQSVWAPAHLPPAHASFAVHSSPSSHGAVLLAFTQPVLASQLSLVQALLSSQLFAGPTVHLPALQVEAAVQASPSPHFRPSAAATD